MKPGRVVFTILFAAAAVTQGTVAPEPTPPQRPLVGNLNNQAKAPAFSSPQEEMAPNGDRVGHYPPYYHPEQSGHRR
ncbi:MAG: hypothetical protein ACLQBD_19055 [Syntrophobacteraceae bacterium]